LKNVVVIGGGHGQAKILAGIKNIDDIHISAIVTVADDGGSTGRIREHYNIPAMGDIRNVLISLSSEKTLIGDLMDFRFEGEDEEDIVGHNLGNLIVTAMTQMSGSFGESINKLSKELKVKGDIIASSLEVLSLYAMMDDETIVKGESNIPNFNHEITKVFYDHHVEANQLAVKAIKEADYIIYGIGSLYTSILPNTIIPGINEALNKSKAKKIYFANCMTQNNETYNYNLKKHIDALRKHNVPIDLVLKHNDVIPKDILDRYALENSIEVLNDEPIDIEVIEKDLLDFSRKLVRHDSNKIRKAFIEVLEKY